MDERHRDRISMNLPELVDKTENVELIIDELVLYGTFTELTASRIMDENDPIERVRMLYSILPECGADAFQSFLEACSLTGNANVVLILKDNRLCNQSPTDGLSPGEESDSEVEVRYRMKTNPRGMVLIVNIFKYENDHKEPRLGSEKDLTNLRRLWEDMGYIVQEEVQGTKVAIEDAIIRWKDQDLMAKVDSGIIILMAHGREGIDPGTVRISTSDKKSVDSEWIIENMSTSNAPKLHGKPKLIFILTCRGQRPDEGTDFDKLTELINSRPRVMLPSPTDTNIDSTGRFEGIANHTPFLSDILLIYPCAPGKASSRDEDKGSWFVQEMCRVFRKKAHKDDVESMLKEMDRNLLKQRLRKERDSFQVICTTSRGFKRRLFLNPVASFGKGN